MADGRWRTALTYAVLGRPVPGPGESGPGESGPGESGPGPDLYRLAAELAATHPEGLAGLQAEVRAHRERGGRWPHPVPRELTEGLGAAQLAAAGTDLAVRLGLTKPVVSRTAVARPLTPAERRLAEDVPPHY